MNWWVKTKTTWLKLQQKSYLEEYQALPSEGVKRHLWVINQQLKELQLFSNVMHTHEKEIQNNKILLHWEKSWFYYQRLLKIQLKLQVAEVCGDNKSVSLLKARREEMEKLFKEHYGKVTGFFKSCVDHHTPGMKDLPHLTRMDMFLW